MSTHDRLPCFAPSLKDCVNYPFAFGSLHSHCDIASGLYTLPAKRSFNLPVLVRNDTQNYIAVRPKAVIAEIHAVQCAIETKQRHDASQTQITLTAHR